MFVSNEAFGGRLLGSVDEVEALSNGADGLRETEELVPEEFSRKNSPGRISIRIPDEFPDKFPDKFPEEFPDKFLEEFPVDSPVC